MWGYCYYKIMHSKQSVAWPLLASKQYLSFKFYRGGMMEITQGK